MERRRAPEPYEIPTEIIKEPDSSNKEQLLNLIHEWWNRDHIEEDELQAKEVSIYYKGNVSNSDNYRPISLLNTLCKVFSALLHIRISETLDIHLRKTPYGLRKVEAQQTPYT